MFDLRVPRGETQRVGGDFELLLGRAAVARCEDGFVFGLLGGEGVEIGVGLSVGRVDVVQFFFAR